MSVIASDSLMGAGNYCFCKGSPEVMLQIMDKSTIPDDYQKVLK